MKLLIFGENGMLGRYLMSYLNYHHEVRGFTRDDLDIYKCFKDTTLTQKTIDILSNYKPDYVINCSGVINKRPDLSVSEMYVVNAYFPLILSDLCNSKNIRLIHPSTGCIFSGYRGMYTNNCTPDCFDDYGASKAIAESIKAHVIRVSIIGEDTNDRSLIEWVRSNKGKTVKGYTNHLWNGITCLQYAKLVNKIIKCDTYEIGIHTHASMYHGNPYINKYKLVQEISDIYELHVNVKPFATEEQCDRTLTPDGLIYADTDLRDQIIEMNEYNILSR
jgi:dTDP-4-dehydrorhamnose reductase